MTSTHTLSTPDADLVYDVRGPLPTADGRPPLFLVAAPMGAAGFETLASLFPDRTVVTYDPRGLGRSTRKDGSTRHTPEQNAADQHAVIEALGAGPVDMFASSGGAICALALVTAYPGDVVTLVAHEPPTVSVLPDAERVFAAEEAVQEAYHARGWGAGMAAFIALSSTQGELPDDFASRPLPDPGAFGLPTEDDGSRDDPLLSGVSNAITAYVPDADAVRASPTRVVVGVGVESAGNLMDRTSAATAAALGCELVEFPGDHGGFFGGEFGQQGQPEAFAARLREVLGS